MSIKLVAFDLDGTFLYDDKSVPAENLRAVKLAAEKGAYLVPASGRIYSGIPDEIKALPNLRYCIAANGAQVYDVQEDRFIYSAEIPNALALEIYEYADSVGIPYDCYMADWGYMTRSMYDMIDEIVDIPGILHLIKTLRKPVDSLPDYLRENGGDLQKIQFYEKDPQKKAEIMAELRRRFPEIAVTSSLPMNIEINSVLATKGQALKALCNHLGIELSESIAFGDGGNDTDMLRTAGIGVAMANAIDEVRQAADYVTLSNMEDGLAKALYRFL